MLAYANALPDRAYEMAATFRVTAKSAGRSAKRVAAKKDSDSRQLLSLSKDLPSTLRGFAQVLDLCAERDDWESPVDPDGQLTPRVVWESVRAEVYPAADKASSLLEAWSNGRASPKSRHLESYAAAVLLAWNNLESAGAEIFGT